MLRSPVDRSAFPGRSRPSSAGSGAARSVSPAGSRVSFPSSGCPGATCLVPGLHPATGAYRDQMAALPSLRLCPLPGLRGKEIPSLREWPPPCLSSTPSLGGAKASPLRLWPRLPRSSVFSGSWSGRVWTRRQGCGLPAAPLVGAHDNPRTPCARWRFHRSCPQAGLPGTCRRRSWRGRFLTERGQKAALARSGPGGRREAAGRARRSRTRTGPPRPGHCPS